jgi:serine/threonine protein kinase
VPAPQAVLSQEIDWEAPELQGLSQAARAFLNRLLQRNPALRPGASEALADPWLADGGAASDAPLNGSVVARLQVRGHRAGGGRGRGRGQGRWLARSFQG